MTRKEAIQKLTDMTYRSHEEKRWQIEARAEVFVRNCEVIGIVKFKTDTSEVQPLFKCTHEIFGVVRVEEWPEGLVVWVGGEIRWKSWS